MPKRTIVTLFVVVLSVVLPLVNPAASLADTDRHALGHGVIRWVHQQQDADQLARVWQHVQDAGSYKFVADVEQTLLPVGLPDQIGEGETEVHLHLEGQTQLPDRAMLSLSLEADGLGTQAMRLYRDGDQLLLQDGATLEPIQDPANTGLQSADYLGYLAGATNVQRSQDERGLDCFAFDIDGQRLAQSQLDELERQLAEDGELPDGAQLSPDGPLTRASGTGELWANAKGLPIRQIIELDIPGLTEGYDAHLILTIDFYDYGCQDTMPTPTQGSDGVWRLEQPSSASTGSIDTATDAPHTGGTDSANLLGFMLDPQVHLSPVSLLLLALMTLGVFLVRRPCTLRQLTTLPNRLYALFAVAMTFIMIASPLLQSGRWVLFAERTALAAGPSRSIYAADDMYQVTEALPTQKELAARTGAAALQSDDDNDDSDGDGLSNGFERALGTNPLHDDTDRDGIDDGTEVNGFDLGGRHWTSNPTSIDSNGDGLPDMDEWPEPNGLANEHDPDGDGVPNLWDEDNDDDGVPDSIDLSPMAVGAYVNDFSVLTEAGNSYDGHLYVEFQVQPEDPDHLRYSTAVLDWPHDEKAQMTDLDDSIDDLRLAPYLRIDSNCAPPGDLSRNYAVRSWANGDRYTIMAPLSPVSDGGQIRTFYTKVALSPNDNGHVPDLDWHAEMIWMVQAEVDQQTRNNDKIVTRSTPLHAYNETCRLTGFKLEKSYGYDTFLLGTPDSQYEDRDLLQAYLGLNALYLEYDKLQFQNENESALDHLNYRFENTFPLTYTLGVDANTCATDFFHYDHEDEAAGDAATSFLPDFLNAHFSADTVCPTREKGDVAHAAILVATENLYGCSDLSRWSGDYTVLHTSLLDIPLVHTRGTKLATYTTDPDTGDWVREEPEELLDIVEERYKNDYEGMLGDLAVDCPNLTVDALRYITHMTYLSAWSGNQRIVASDDTLYIEAGPVDDGEICEQYGVSAKGDTFGDAPTFVAWVSGLGETLDDAIAENERAWGADNPLSEEAFASEAVSWVDNNPGLADMMGTGPIVPQESSRAVQMLKKYDMSIKQVRLGMAGFKLCLLAKSVRGSFKLWRMAKNAASVKDVLKATEAANKFPRFALVGMVLSIAMTWVIFGMYYGAIKNDPAALNMAIAVSVVNTIWFIFLFALNFIPILGQIISGILSLIDGILSWATDGNWSMSHVIVRFFYDARSLTEPGDADFRNMDTGVRNERLGLAEGNYFYVEAEFEGTMTTTEDGEDDDLKNSWVKGYLWKTTGTLGSISAENHVSYNTSGSTKTCRNNPSITFGPLVAQPNVTVGITPVTKFQYRWAEYGLYGAFRWSTKSKLITTPESDDRETQEIVIDVLPADLDGLWTWNLGGDDHVWNPDRDADGIPNDDEAGYGTDPDNWDTDGDGVSDKWELDNADEFGLDVLVADTDGDSLNDGYELRLGTLPAVADTDADGLTDAEEVFHFDAERGWMGSWQANMPGDTTERVYPNPMSADADLDNMDDSDERDNHLSPYAHNDAPRLRIVGENRVISPSGQWGTWMLPNADLDIRVELLNTGSLPVTTTLALCVADIVQVQSGGDMSAEDPPSTQISTCDATGIQYAWDFSGHELTAQRESTTTLSVRTLAADETVSATLPLHLTYRGQELEREMQLTIDADWPKLTVAAPANGAFIRGDRYVFGGSAKDNGSWVTDVDVRVYPEGGQEAAWQGAEGQRLWAYGWDLPSDGRYQVNVRATDYVGHVTDDIERIVTVDNTPPTMNLTLPGGNYVRPEDEIVHITGQAMDNLAGVRRVQISMNGQPWRAVELDAPGATSTPWHYAWPIGDDAQGRHSLLLRAVDMAGNVSDTIADELIVDQMAPTDELTDRTYTSAPPAVRVGQEHLLVGVANESGRLPKTARPPKLTDRMDNYDDSSIWLGMSGLGDNDQGIAAAWLGDIDNDRLADLAIGLPADDRVAFCYGQSGDWALPPDLEMLDDATTQYVGPQGSGFGAIVAPAGDADGDALLDVLVGMTASTDAYLIRGRTGPQGELDVDGANLPSWSVLHAPGQINGLASAGDINDDGIDDLLIVAEGRCFLVLGQLFPWPETLDIEEEAAAILPNALAATGLGDIDGDGLADYGITRDGAVFVYCGGDDLEAGDQHEPLATASFATADASPFLAATGDLNGDALMDLAYSDGITPQVVLGRSHGAWDVSRTLNGYNPAPSGYVAAPGDVDGDGHADLMLSNNDDELYLILGREDWTSAPPIKTTFEHTMAIAQTPYASAADLNGDGSSDLVLIPEPSDAENRGYDAQSFAGIAWVSAYALPEAKPIASAIPQPDGVVLTALGLKSETDALYVDDDYCATCQNDGYTWGQNAFDTIPSAITAASSDATIHVQPGVYPPFLVDAGKDDITIRGTHADAVFVDADGGAYGIKLAHVRGVTLADMTVRDADHGIWLDDAGLLGHETPAYRCALDGLLVHNCNEAIYSDRSSSVEVRSCTLATDGQPEHPLIQVDTSEPDPDLYRWTAGDDVGIDISHGGAIVAGPGGTYAIPGGDTKDFYRLDTASSQWQATDNVPVPVSRHATADTDENGDVWMLLPDEFGGFNEPVRDIMVRSANDITVASDQDMHTYDGNGWETEGNSTATLCKEIDGVLLYSGDDGNVMRCANGQCEALGRLMQDSIWDGYLYDVAVDGDDVYFAGDFDRVQYWSEEWGVLDDLYTKNIAKWNVNEGWQHMGHEYNDGLEGPNGGDCYGIDYVKALLIKDGHLYAGGFFYRGYNTNTQNEEVELRSNNVIGYDLNSGEWEKIAGPSSGSGGIITTEHEWSNGDCDSTVYVYDLASWDSDTILIVGEFDHYGDELNGPGGEAWNMAFYNTNNTWTAPPDWARTNGAIHDVEWQGSTLYVGGEFTSVTATGTAISRVARFDYPSRTWSALGSGVDGPVYALDYLTDNTTLYVGGDFGTAGNNGHYNIARWNENTDTWPGGQFLYQYNGSWLKHDAPPSVAGEGAILAANLDGDLYCLLGADTDEFLRYDLAEGTWHSLASRAAEPGSVMCCASGTPYVIPAEYYDHLWSYQNGSWQIVNHNPPEVGIGADMVWDGADTLYLLVGGGSSDWWRYDLDSDSWEQMDDPGIGAFAAYGHGLARHSNSIYAYLSPMGQGSPFYECSRVGVPNTKLVLEATALIAPSTASAPVWISPGKPNPDYGIVNQGNSDWVADVAWSPAVAQRDSLTHSRAKLFAPSDDLYRPSRDSLLGSGYADYLGEARVSPTYCAVCENDGFAWGVDAFDSIQDGIDSGANHVLIGPGVYQEPFYLISGAQVSGHGAGYTIIEAPVAWNGPLAQAEGIAQASLSRMSLVGNNSGQGLLVEDGAQVQAKRMIIRSHATGIACSGDTTEVEVVNNTVVGNTDGIVLADNAPVDVRNTILAYNSGRGLAFETDALYESHTYNDYWANGIDLDYDDSLSAVNPGSGEMFLDPLFEAPMSHDYRPTDDSPAIDAGAVNDPAPPGAGGRTDIGYAENGRASFYVDDDYTPAGDNDGLTWASDAFAAIQSALDAAAVTIRALDPALPEEGYSINVAAGNYQEAPSLPSYVHVVGSGADQTTIELAQEDGAAVQMAGIVNASIADIEIAGSKGTSSASLVQAITSTFTSLVMDSNANLVAGYLAEDITIANHDGYDWAFDIAEIVTATDITDMEMLLDSNDYPHIMYAHPGRWQNEDRVYWLRWDGSEWIKTIAVDGYAGDYIGFALDDDDHPILAYTNNSSHRVYTMRWDGSAWADNREAGHYQGYSDENLSVGTYAYSANETYRYAGFGSNDEVRRYYYRDQDVHSTQETVLDSVGLAHDINLIVEPSPDPVYGWTYLADHYVYGTTDGRLRHWWGYRGQHKETVDSGTNIGYHNALAMDDHHMPHVAYTKDGELWYGCKTKEVSQDYDEGVWTLARVDDGSEGEIKHVDIAVDSTDKAHVIYHVTTPSGPETKYRTVWFAGEQYGLLVSEGSHDVTAERLLIHNVDQGVVATGRSSGEIDHCTLAAIRDEGVLSTEPYTLLRVNNTIVTGAAVGLVATDNAQLVSEYNLVNCDTDVDGATLGDGMLYADPSFDKDYHITAASPAVDAADPYGDVPVGGGLRADIGYHELIAAPLPILLGQEIRSTAIGNSGVQASETGISFVADPSLAVTETLPSVWTPAALAGQDDPVTQWTTTVTPDQEGLYRVYSRAADLVGNDEADENDEVWYAGAYIGDATPPAVAWVTPDTDTSAEGAAIRLVAQASDYVEDGSGSRFSVEEVSFLVDGERHTARWVDDPDWDPDARQARHFEAYVSLAAGEQNVQAVAVDQAGHEASTGALTINATNNDHCVTVTSHSDAQAVRETSLELQGHVRYASLGSGKVDVQIDGQPATQAVLANPIGQRTTWQALALLPDSDGSHTITITPTLGSAGSVATLSLLLDRAGPTLNVTSPADSSTVTDTVLFEGTTSDELSAVTQVAYSLDGGYTWQELDRQGNAFSKEVDLPDGKDSVSYPIRIRSVDAAGNETVMARVVSLDSQPPIGLAPTTFNHAPGTHVQIGTQIDMTWAEPWDAGGVAGTRVEFGRADDTIPTASASGTSLSATLSAVGEWYAHLAAEDSVGNERVLHFGPWYVEDTYYDQTTSGSSIVRPAAMDLKATSLADSRQSIIIDGLLDLAHDEWLPSEWLDDALVNDTVQDLYVAWDGLALFFGYGGAWWNMDGELWLYVDIASGGSPNQPTAPELLPIEADWAVQVVDPSTAMLWQWDGASWTSQAWDYWAMGASTGQTEVRLPWATINDGTPATVLSIVARTRTEEDKPAVVMPTTNPESDVWTEAFSWPDTTSTTSPGSGQPRALDVTLDVECDTPANALLGPDQTVRYRLTATNHETRSVSGVRIAMDASPGLGYFAPLDPADGATCASCPEGGTTWVLSLPEIAASSYHVITVTARTAASLQGVSQVTSTASLTASPDPVVGEPVVIDTSHRADGQGAVAYFDAQENAPVPVGTWQSSGSADDGDGIGVQTVQVRLSGESWQDTSGTLVWQSDLTIPDTDQVTVEARAQDAFGQYGATGTRNLLIDRVAPDISWSAPIICAGDTERLSGTASDPAPDTGRIDEVSLQFDDPANAWLAAAMTTSPDGTTTWRYDWSPPHEDGVSHRIRARAVDLVGLETVDGWQLTTVDTVPPAITTTKAVAQETVDGYGAPRVVELMTGKATDGMGVREIAVRVTAADDSVYTDLCEREGDAWRYAPDISSWPAGTYELVVLGTDINGNQRQEDPHTFQLNRVLPALEVEHTRLSINGIVGNTTAHADDLVQYRTIVRNVGDGTAVSIQVTATLPTPEMRFVGTTSVSRADLKVEDAIMVGGKITWPLNARLEAGQALTVTFDARVTNAITPPVTLTTHSGATGRTEGGESIVAESGQPGDHDQDDADSSMLRADARQVSLTIEPDRSEVCAGWNYHYDLTIVNDGETPLADLAVRVALPANSEPVMTDSWPTWEDAGDHAWVWDIADLAPSQRATARLTAHLFTSLSHGETITIYARAVGIQIITRTETLTSTVRTDGPCAPGQPTPTTAPTLTPLPTPRGAGMWLPLILRGASMNSAGHYGNAIPQLRRDVIAR